ncbi:hypothetical protein SAMN05192583_2253 [Sphingomonas gellani]|uniref:Hpt domain-containing protein n=1 Tax=Sphingomonas gellani TaxID=1166340 RepID=A0A1H8EPB6_9SPHN|nr:Hpt domain-containing protein [Sphingomonas gellani]SEN21292.1 hypothetical protein SAMN05192583_2253 [Sphingomonas gellani]
MAYDPGAIDAALAAAVGDEPGLVAELRLAFVDSATRVVAGLETASDATAWRDGTARLRGLAASFGAVRLMALAADAAKANPADPATLTRLKRAIARF